MADHEDTEVDVATDAMSSRSTSHGDLAGAVLVVAGLVGAAAGAWSLVRTQLDQDDAGVGTRLDLIADDLPTLLLAAAVAGLGFGLRLVLAARTGEPAPPPFGKPVGLMSLGVAAVLGVLVAGIALLDDGDDDDTVFDIAAAWDDIEILAGPGVVAPPEPVVREPPAPTYSLEVHTDGCGVIRSGEVGDDLTWVVTDEDGFRVLGRNAAGETRYRYFRPGSYTVVLEAWAGSFYAPVSNEVTITC